MGMTENEKDKKANEKAAKQLDRMAKCPDLSNESRARSVAAAARLRGAR